jgi:putative endonuclease
VSRRLAEKRARKGESFATLWTRLRGSRVIARRVKIPCGEIDLIARRARPVSYLRKGDSPRIGVLLLAPGCWPRHIVKAWQP